MEHPIEISALSNDTQIFVHRQHLCGAGPENRLRVGKDDLIHFARPIRFGPGISLEPALKSGSAGYRGSSPECNQLRGDVSAK